MSPSNSLPNPSGNIEAEARLAMQYTAYLRAHILASLELFDTLTVPALVLALSELRREATDRRNELGRVLWANTIPPTPPAPDVKPLPKHPGGKP